MIKVGDKNWSQLDDNEKISYLKDNLVDPALRERQQYDNKWYLAKRFQAGDHYIEYNTVTNVIENPPRKRGAVRLVINLVKAHTRAIKNFITSSQPKAEIMPGDVDEDTVENASRVSAVIDYLHSTILHLNSKIRMAVDDIVDTTIAFFEIGWDDQAKKGMGEVFCISHDPFEIVLPLTATLDGPIILSPFIAKVSPVNVNDIRADERYDKKKRQEVEPDDELAASTVQARLKRNQGQKGIRSEGQQTVMRYEVMVWDSEGNKEGGNVNIYTFAADKMLKEEETDLVEYQIYALQDEPRRRIYGETSTTAVMIPLNKGINRLESQKLENNNNTLRPRVLAEKGHGINFEATGRHGSEVEVLEHNPGKNVQWWQASPISDGGQAEMLAKYMETLSGVYEAMFGRNPAGGRSGDMLEQLIAAGANNLAGLQMSLHDFLPVVYSRILDIIADKYVATRVMKIAGAEGEEHVKVIGEEGGSEPEGAVIVNKDNEVIVKIGSWLGYTKDAQREALMSLGEMGAVDTETILKMLDFPNVSVIAQKAREERLEEAEIQADIAGRRGEGGGGGMEMGAPVGVGPEIADEENARMMNGEFLPPTPGASPEHTQAHVDFVQSPDAQMSPEAMQAIAQHAQGELDQQQGGGA